MIVKGNGVFTFCVFWGYHITIACGQVVRSLSVLTGRLRRQKNIKNNFRGHPEPRQRTASSALLHWMVDGILAH